MYPMYPMYPQDKVKELGLAFPDKLYAGSLLGTLNAVTSQRTTDLQVSVF
jgi:hypothetical protein